MRDEEHRGAALPQDAVHDAVHQLRAHLVRVRVRVGARVRVRVGARVRDSSASAARPPR